MPSDRATILVVEDEAHLAEGLQFNLEAEGYEVEIAECGTLLSKILEGLEEDDEEEDEGHGNGNGPDGEGPPGRS